MQSGTLWTSENQHKLQTLYLLQKMRRSTIIASSSAVSAGDAPALCDAGLSILVKGALSLIRRHLFYIACCVSFPERLLSIRSKSTASLFFSQSPIFFQGNFVIVCLFSHIRRHFCFSCFPGFETQASRVP